MAIDRISSVRSVRLESPAGQSHGSALAVPAGGASSQLGDQQQSCSSVSREAIDHAVQELNRTIEHVNQRLSFKVHEGSERMMVYVIDNKTNEVVREMPPEKFLDTIAKIREFVGLLFDAWF